MAAALFGARQKKAESGLLPRNGVSQWSTLESGPLATPEMAEFRAFASKKREPVVHFGEWSTGFPEKGRNQAKAPKSRELVVHSKEWSTSFLEKGRIQAKAPKYRELVVHFGKWTTSFLGKG